MSFILVFIFSYLSFALSALCGGGAGLILMPVLSKLLVANQVPVALSIGTFTSSASRLVVFFRSINWHIVKYFLPAALPAVALGALLLKYVNPLYMEIAMSIFLIANIPLVLKKNKDMNEIVKPSNLKLTAVGFCAGFLSGFTGAVGLLFNKLYLRYGLTKEQIVATRAANEIILHVIKIILYICFGLIGAKAISVGVSVAVAAMLSTWTMKWILPHLKDALFKKIGYAAMVVSGFIMLGQAAQRTTLDWKYSGYSLEYTYDDGFEFELVIPITELTEAQQKIVAAQKVTSDKIVIEAVYSFKPVSYEAYYFYKNKRVNKVEFE